MILESMDGRLIHRSAFGLGATTENRSLCTVIFFSSIEKKKNQVARIAPIIDTRAIIISLRYSFIFQIIIANITNYLVT